MAALVAISQNPPLVRSEVLGVYLRRGVALASERALLDVVGICSGSRLRDDRDHGAGEFEPSVPTRAGHDWTGAAGARSAPDRRRRSAGARSDHFQCDMAGRAD